MLNAVLKTFAGRIVYLMGSRDFSKKIIDWYLLNPRDLPWRKTKDPYRIWLSEIILQQTRVAQGLPYYLQFVRNFPNVKALANAPLEKVLRTWQGLGYYSRARNLHACAKEIAFNYNGNFPDTYSNLLTLPGIGSYTAAALSSIAFDKPDAVVDGNVFRVLSRIFGIQEDISSSIGKKTFYNKAQALLDPKQPGTFNQAIMEFGALHCTPKSPGCVDCIFASGCYANKNQMQALLPVNNKKVKVRNRYFTYFILMKGNKMALKKREGKDIWSGLYDFYLIEGLKRKKPESILSEDHVLKTIRNKATIVSQSEAYKHILTHQRIEATFVILSLSRDFLIKDLKGIKGLKFYSSKEILALPKPVLISRFLSKNGILE